MPVPVWDCSDLLLDEPLDTVLSDDIWKKFDLDEPLDVSYVHGHHVSGSASSGGLGDRTLTAMTMMMNSSSSSISSSSSSSSSLGYSSSSSDDSSTTHSASSITLPEFYDTFGCSDPRKIRHHDCMWAGLCISKEHNRTLPAKKDSQVHSRKVAAGRSLLISSRPTTTTATTTIPQIASHQQMQQQTNLHQHQILQQSSHPQRRKDSLESDGDSGRPETPQSSEESETESEAEDEEDEEEEEEEEDEEEEEERVMATARGSMLAQRRTPRVHEIKREPVDGPLVFRHDQISINEKLSECMSETSTTGPPTPPPRAAPVSEVTGQLVRKFHHRGANHDRIKVEGAEYQSNGISSGNQQQPQQQQQQHGTIAVKKEPDSWNTLSDHCYHQPSSKKLEHLGVQTPSDSEEEIDVVTFEKPCRPAALPTNPSIADQQHFQLTVNSALKEKPASAPRPRGRPPSSGGGGGGSSVGAPRKRGNAQPDQKPAKRARHRTYQRRSKVTKNGPPTPVASPLKTASTTTASPGSASSMMTPSSSSSSMAASTSRSNSSSDDEPDTEKRSLHNNMERQRRIELRNAFEDLRVLVPEVEAKEKAPKVAILRQAAVYCDMLTEINQVSVARVIEMKRRQERLRARLSQLRRSLAMTR